MGAASGIFDGTFPAYHRLRFAHKRAAAGTVDGGRPNDSAAGPDRLDVESVQPEKADVMARLAVLGQVGHDLADHAGELESVA